MDDIQIEWYLVIKQTANTNVKPLGNSLESQEYMRNADAMSPLHCNIDSIKVVKKKIICKPSV